MNDGYCAKHDFVRTIGGFIFCPSCRIEALEGAINGHNDGCQAACGKGDREAVACGYRPYFENSGRRCPNCPTYDIIDMPGSQVSDAGEQ
jgi:hypothetical protein